MRNFRKKEVQKLKLDIDTFREKYDISLDEFVVLFDSNHLPLSIFSTDLSPMEAVVKFLKEDLDKKISEIARILGKQPPAVWLAYNNSKIKHKSRFSIIPSRYDIPIEKLSSGNLSLLEIISSYLIDEHKLSFRDAGKILNRNERTVWTAYHRAKKKREYEK